VTQIQNNKGRKLESITIKEKEYIYVTLEYMHHTDTMETTSITLTTKTQNACYTFKPEDLKFSIQQTFNKKN